ncbi:Panacea domain-containing protein [Streptobacillus moniliformis]|uniref:Panacea domain-containing protein n=1 Tax=Streptobacillus moniliformis TaxID=34105 RepID=UPI0007E3DED9|nr:type II toxin-antitoxin system antitoxin SocA domain-containing protein [Streptobacillus moniliformis]
MNSALDVARYVINYCNERDISITNLKLQKLLYFIQVYFLCYSSNKRVCFKEKIFAWEFGPVVQEVYEKYRVYKDNLIPPQNEINFNEEDTRDINRVLNDLANRNPFELVKLTHRHLPWINNYPNGEITLQELRDFYG